MTTTPTTATEFSYNNNIKESLSVVYNESNKMGSNYCLDDNKFDDTIHFHDLQLDKKLLLQKYFRNALIGPRSNIYENLCRGCNYGVFNARGPLCTFCECLVGGVTAINENNSINSLTPTTTTSTTPTTRTTSNIYENICEKCNQIYANDHYDNYDDNDNCTCDCHEDNSSHHVCDDDKKIYYKSEEHLDNINKGKSQKIINNIKKSKSFNKTDKKNVLRDFFGNWKRPKKLHSTADVNSSNNNKHRKSRKKSLEILHNVEGYDQVFHTQEIFDLQRMCEMKRHDDNCRSDQHIYGRLKLQKEYAQQQQQNNLDDRQRVMIKNRSSQTLPLLSQLNNDNDNSFMSISAEFIKANSLSNTSTTSPQSHPHYHSSTTTKRPRISRPRLLRLRSLPLEKLDGHKTKCHNHNQKDTKSHERQQSQSIYLPDNVCQWMTQLRYEIFPYDSLGFCNNAEIGFCYPKSIPAKQQTLTYLPSSPPVVVAAELLSINKDLLMNNECVDNTREAIQYDCNISDMVDFQEIIDEFKRNLIAKKELRIKCNSKEHLHCSNQYTKINLLNSQQTNLSTNFNNLNQHNQKHQDIILRRLNNTKDIHIDNDDNSFVVERRIKVCMTNEKTEHFKLVNNECNRFIPVNLELNNSTCISQRNASEVNGLNNSDLARKRCGIHERNSEFVNDILNIFEHLLHREKKCDIINESENYSKGDHSIHLTNDRTATNEINKDSYKESRVARVKTSANTFRNNEDDFIKKINFTSLIEHNYLSIALNCLVIYYNKYLLAFLKRNHNQIESTNNEHLRRKFQIIYCKYARAKAKCTARDIANNANIIHTAIANVNTKCQTNQIENKNENVRVKKCETQINGMCNSLQSELDLNNINYGNLSCMNLSPNESNVVLEEIQPKIYNNNKNNNKSNAITQQQQQQQRHHHKEKLQKTKVNVLMKTSNEKITINLANNNNNNNNDNNKNNVNNNIVAATIATGENYINVVSDVKKKLKIPPKVPKRDPKTQLCTKIIVKDMKVTATQLNQMDNSNTIMEDDGIYQSIWKFKTLGEVPETDYYDDLANIHKMKTKLKTNENDNDEEDDDNDEEDDDDDDTSLISEHSINRNHCLNDDPGEAIVDDHNAWETDDEFMFTTRLDNEHITNNYKINNNNNHINKIITEKYDTVRSNHSSNSNYSSIENNSNNSFSSNYSLSGSTITGFASSNSTATMASALSTNFNHPLLRSVGIFYSPTETKLRAIIYNYDRIQSSVYFAKKSNIISRAVTTEANDQVQNREIILKCNKITSSSIPSPSPSAWPCKNRNNNNNNNNYCNDNGTYENDGIGESVQTKWSKLTMTTITTTITTTSISTATTAAMITTTAATPSTPITSMNDDCCQSISDSVQAWKFLLLDVNYIEDEEDMIVSECEILRAQQIKEDVSSNDQMHQQNILQRFKSISSGNLIDLPIEDDKKTIAERMRNKLQRGVFKINARSPKSEKKTRNIFRRTETASLYLEDGLKPKFPIFGTALDYLELNQTTQPNVPRFVVDCVDYIEQRDRIIQDGLYRACGNKFSIDELKQKLMESYVYDTKLLHADDIHTITSLLKQFFRELGAPLIPQDIYERLGRNLNDHDGIERIREVLLDMKEPNRSTLKYIIKHLTNVAAHSSSNRMNASNLAIVWGPCLLSANQINFDIARMNTFAKVLIENYERIFTYDTNERLVC